jgi:hypothetical protein
MGALQPTFNQFQVLDMSLSNSIQYFDAILDGLDSQMGLIMGITRQAMGQTVNTDQVGTFQMSQQSTLLVTESYYAKHDEIERQALSLMINLARQFLWDKETIMSYINENSEEEIVEIPAHLLNKKDFRVLLERSPADERKLNQLKEFHLQNYAKGMLPWDTFLNLFNVESLIEMQKKSEYFAVEARKIQDQSRQAEQQSQIELITAKEKLKGEMTAQVKQVETEMKKMALQLDQQRLQLEDYVQRTNLALQEKALSLQDKGQEQDAMIRSEKIKDDGEKWRAELGSKQQDDFLKNEIAHISTRLNGLKIMMDDRTKNRQIQTKQTTSV